MQVNVFVMRRDGETPSELLVLPMPPEAATQEKYQIAWNYYATVDTGDRMFGEIDARAIEAEIAASGFAVVTPQVPDRRGTDG
jgi:hypothetical protein